MEKRNIIVIGASAGGLDPLHRLICMLPPDLKAIVLIVWHIAAESIGVLPTILNKCQTLPARNAVDLEILELGQIYVAPPDHHLIVEKDHIRITKGPKENRFRPAVDVLFRTAATAFGSRVIGVILSGALDDGTAGLWVIKQLGGIAIVQDPHEAEIPSMPNSALRSVHIDHVLPIDGIATKIMELVKEDTDPFAPKFTDQPRIDQENEIAKLVPTPQIIKLHGAQVSPFTCPECHGVLSSIQEGGRIRFRCHTGHAYSADSLLRSIGENIEASLWIAARSVQESIMFLNQMGDHFADANQPKVASTFFKNVQETETKLLLLKKALNVKGSLKIDVIEPESADV